MNNIREWPDLHDRTLTFKMMWEVELCALRFILSWMRVRGELPPEVVQATKIGKAFERIRAAVTKKERRAAVRSLVARVEPEQVPVVMKKLRVCLMRAADIDAQNRDVTGQRKSLKSPQYYAKVTQFDKQKPLWRLAARPDEMQFEANGLIRIIDEKTGGRMSKRLRDNFFFFGLVISLAETEGAKAELAKALDLHHELCENERKRCRHKQRSARGKKQGGRSSYEQPYYPAKPRMAPRPHIELKPILTGSVVNETGEEVAATQPLPFNYSFEFEAAQLKRVREAIAKIEDCFDKKEFLPESNRTCGFCPYRHGCPGYEQQQNSGLVEMTTPGESGLECDMQQPSGDGISDSCRSCAEVVPPEKLSITSVDALAYGASTVSSPL